MNITSEMIFDIFVDTIVNHLWPVMSPILIPIMIVSVIAGLFKLCTNRFIYFHSILSGESKREAKRKMKFADNLIDFFSALKDIFPSK